ncbi:Imm63 family immunity protein [Kitasatospora cineracea]|uniref:Imm63 family immunity protein n=1 Tax=Kitasatospora cineracea TaxID=88074 RepID=UPI0033FD99DF
MTITMEDLRAGVERIAARLDGVERRDLVGFAASYELRPYLEVHDGVAHWILGERSDVLDRRTTRDLDEALYWAAREATRPLSWRRQAARQHLRPPGREPGHPARIVALAEQAALLRGLDPAWGRRFLAELPAEHPGVPAAEVAACLADRPAD